MICTREYDTDTERLNRIFARKTAGGEVRFQDLRYGYDPVGNPVQITDELATSTFTSNQIVPNTRTFRYDPRYRLIRSTGKRHKDATDGVDAPVVPSPALTDYVPYTHRYSYDAVGNFTTNQEYKSGTSNLKYKAGLPDLFDGWGAESYSYDANGCCTSTPRHVALGYSFDAQPVFVDMGGGTVVRYRRHGDQRAVRLLSKNGVKALGVYLGPWEYHRRTGTTAYTKVVLHVEGASRLAQAERVLARADPDSLAVFHVHADHLGSAQVLTKSDGTLLCQEEFFAYGRSSDRRDARSRYRYIGVECDEDTGLRLAGPRLLDSAAGRFLQPDSADIGSLHRYAHQTPLRMRDDNGYKPAESASPSVPDPKFPEPVFDELLAGLSGPNPTLGMLEPLLAEQVMYGARHPKNKETGRSWRQFRVDPTLTPPPLTEGKDPEGLRAEVTVIQVPERQLGFAPFMGNDLTVHNIHNHTWVKSPVLSHGAVPHV